MDLYLLLLVFSTIYIVDSEVNDVDPKYFCENPDHLDESVLQNVHKCYCEPYNPSDMKDKPSIVRFPVYGRVSNMMIGYAIMLSMKIEYGFRTFLDTAVLLNLKHYFKNIKNVSNSESLCFYEYPWKEYLQSPQSLASDKYLSTGHAIQYVKGCRLLGNNINGILNWNLILNKHEEIIRNAFTFRKKYITNANKKLRYIKNNVLKLYKLKTDPDDENKKKKVKIRKNIPTIVFVGVHVRRTDFENGFIQRYNLPELKPSYFLSAMDEYIRYVKTFDTMSKVVFLLVSDDMKWTKMNIYSRARSHYNIFLAGNGNGENVDAVGMDMALLASCNHTILSYGTFSFWSGFLSGGKRIIPSMIINKWKKPLDKNLGSFVFPDEGLVYESDTEKQTRLNVDNVISF